MYPTNSHTPMVWFIHIVHKLNSELVISEHLQDVFVGGRCFDWPPWRIWGPN